MLLKKPNKPVAQPDIVCLQMTWSHMYTTLKIPPKKYPDGSNKINSTK